MKAIRTSTATVYQGARKRYLSKAAAARSFFWAALRRHCECEDPDYSGQYPGMVCHYHSGDHRDRIAMLRRRFMGIHFGNRAL